MTILDACVEVLKTAESPMTARMILDEILRRDLYRFGAKDRQKVLSGTLRQNLRKGTPPVIREVERGKYLLT